MPLLRLILALIFLALPAHAQPTHALSLRFDHSFAGEPLPFNDVSLRTAGGNTLSVSRLSYLISNITLLRAGAAPLTLPESIGFINAPERLTAFTLQDIPGGTYTGISFYIGLDPAKNHSDPALYPAGHSLNPLFNGLHWSWQGGYVFLAIEGRYVLPADKLGGYSYHIATDAHRMHVELHHPFTLEQPGELALDFDVAKLFSTPNIILVRHASGEDSTHSAENDPLAPRIATNITQAFQIRGLTKGISAPRIQPEPIADPPAGTLRYYLKIPKGFGPPALPPDNPLTVQGVALGEKLFFEKRLSYNNAQSCADCHKPAAAFSDPGEPVSKGTLGLPGHRNTMPLFNLAWMTSMTWDGKRSRLRDQALAPIQDEREMHQSLPDTIAKLESTDLYPQLFAKAFGSAGITADRIGLALEQFLLTLISGDSTFDRAMREEMELAPEEKRGLDLFVLEFDPLRGRLGADCFHCHGNELFTSNQFANNGLDSTFTDQGRSTVTNKPSDLGKFKVPSLRNVELTAPYMHDGRFATLEEVVDHYADGIHPSDSLDPNISKHPDGGLALSCEDRKALVAFLKALTDLKYKQDQ